MKEYICIYDEDDMMYILNPYVAQNTELIRCKDCIRWRRSKSDITAMVCDWDRYEKAENDFCSWAKRRDDETD